MSNSLCNGSGILDDSFDMLANIKLEGPSESESANEEQDDMKKLPVTTEDEIIQYQIPSCNFYEPANPPYCDRCIAYDHQIYFSLTCKLCEKKLDNTTVPQIFAIMRQWSSETQHEMAFYINKVSLKFFLN